MAVLDFRSSYFDYLVEGMSTKDADGFVIKGEPHWVNNYMACNIVPAGQANQISIPDGTVETYSYTIHTDPSCKEFKYGDKVRIHVLGGEGEVKTVKGYHRYQLQAKIWV